ncbi:hypothetical protein NFI96_032718, partial [Prochilodus magdalenae]
HPSYLYLDASEVVNPSGSAAYGPVANLPVHVRSDSDHVSLVLLCREKDSEDKAMLRCCLITPSEFQGDDPNLCGPERTMESYTSAVDHLQTEETPDVEGIQF